ncbi:hypothetical protein DRN86_03215 [Candidatus Geothermarchaeota archaeon]|nr:MAG: hypothetical protein DRN86_03215 [Candidatus Geothermarchaeota archaeon]
MDEKWLKLLLDSNIKLLLEKIAKKEPTERITPSIDLSVRTKYSIGDEDITLTGLEEVLNKLSEAKILKKKRRGNVIKCYACGSTDVITQYLCPTCGSSNISKNWLVQHLTCGNTFMVEELKLDGITCPKCGRRIPKDDLSIIGGIFACKGCGSRFDAPMLVYSCLSCRNKFTLKELDFAPIYSFEIEESAKEFLEAFGLILDISNQLEKEGYKVDFPGQIVGNSGITHTFPLLITTEKGKIAVEPTFYNKSITPAYYLQLYAKLLDAPSLHLLLLVGNLTEDVKSLIESSKPKNLSVFIVSSAREIIERIKQFIEGLKEVEAK